MIADRAAVDNVVDYVEYESTNAEDARFALPTCHAGERRRHMRILRPPLQSFWLLLLSH